MAIIPDRRWERFVGWFNRYVRRLVRRRFAAVRVLGDDARKLADLDAHDGPLIVIMNHASWWDPLVGLLLADALVPSRDACAPMDAVQLRRLGMFRWLGVFGVDPDDPETMREMAEYVSGRFEGLLRPSLWITPQGEFTDVRAPVVMRPGAAAVAARLAPELGPLRVIAIGIEYVFWQDQLPELAIAIDEVCPGGGRVERDGLEPPGLERAGLGRWHRAMQSQLQATLDRLAAAVIARDEAAFRPLLTGAQGKTGFIYDLWLRLRGRSGRIEARRAPSAVGPNADGAGEARR